MGNGIAESLFQRSASLAAAGGRLSVHRPDFFSDRLHGGLECLGDGVVTLVAIDLPDVILVGDPTEDRQNIGGVLSHHLGVAAKLGEVPKPFNLGHEDFDIAEFTHPGFKTSRNDFVTLLEKCLNTSS